MMSRLSKSVILLTALILPALLFVACNKNRSNATFTQHLLGYQYQLISFQSDSCAYPEGSVALVDAVFKTQSDSVFWDSHNNLNDRLFIRLDSNQNADFFRYHVSRSCMGDSSCLLIRKSDFFKQQFKIDSVPFFSEEDSVVKVFFKVKEVMNEKVFNKLSVDLHNKELSQMESYFNGPAAFEAAYDTLGFYWIEKPDSTETPGITMGDVVTLSYASEFLNGRFFEKSGDDFEFVYGTPDQLLKGLNYVIGRLKLGQNAKILLPSRLAFGESGSSNGIVPPYTPLIYAVKIIDVKKINEKKPSDDDSCSCSCIYSL